MVAFYTVACPLESPMTPVMSSVMASLLCQEKTPFSCLPLAANGKPMIHAQCSAHTGTLKFSVLWLPELEMVEVSSQNLLLPPTQARLIHCAALLLQLLLGEKTARDG